MANAIMVIYPYKHQGVWVFDDEIVGLVQEPFVSGADEIIEKMVAEIPDAENGFILFFLQARFRVISLYLSGDIVRSMVVTGTIART